MSTPSDAERPQPVSSDELQTDIEHTREQLGQTVDALSEKLDVKAQAEYKLHNAKDHATAQLESMRGRAERVAAQAKDAATDEQDNLKPAVPIGAALITAAIAAVVVIVVRRRR